MFERSPKIGGLLRYGIPDFKLEKHILDRRIRQMEAEGVRFETGVTIGEDISARYLRGNFDVILLTMGAGEPRDLEVPGRELGGVHFAMDYLTRSNMFQAGEIGEEKLIAAKDKVALVIGGGDTGSDCVGTATRMGARKVLPVRDHAQAARVERGLEPELARLAEHPAHLQLPGGGLRAGLVHHDQVLQRQGRQGDGRALCPGGVEEGLQRHLCDEGDPGERVLPEGRPRAPGHGLCPRAARQDPRGAGRGVRPAATSADPDYATSAPGVFAAGDANTGASLVVRAIFHGRQAAAGIDRYLKG